MKSEETWQNLIIESWENPEFKKNLIENPSKFLQSIDLNLKNKKIEIVEDKEDLIHLVLQTKPTGILTQDCCELCHEFWTIHQNR